MRTVMKKRRFVSAWSFKRSFSTAYFEGPGVSLEFIEYSVEPVIQGGSGSSPTLQVPGAFLGKILQTVKVESDVSRKLDKGGIFEGDKMCAVFRCSAEQERI